MINLLKVNRSHINNKKKSKHDAQENYASQLSTIKVIQENKRYINNFFKREWSTWFCVYSSVKCQNKISSLETTQSLLRTQ